MKIKASALHESKLNESINVKYDDISNIRNRVVLARGDELIIEAIPSKDRSRNDMTREIIIRTLEPVNFMSRSGRGKVAMRPTVHRISVGLYDSEGTRSRYSVGILDEYALFTSKYYGHFDDVFDAVPVFNRVVKHLLKCIDIDDAQTTYENLMASNFKF